MTMDKGEIIREYKAAKYPKKMIPILADLNCCSRDEIRDILGIETSKKTKPVQPKKQPKKQKQIPDDAKIMRMYSRLDELDKQIVQLESEYRHTVQMLMAAGQF